MTKSIKALVLGLAVVGPLFVSPLAAATEPDAAVDNNAAAVHRLGEHPSVIVQRLHAKQGYDYASKFYPHPAWLWLHAEAPRPMMDHPAVIVAKRQKENEAQAAPPARVSASTPAPLN